MREIVRAYRSEIYATRVAEGILHVVHPKDELQGLVGSSKLDINVQAVHSGVRRATSRCTIKVEGDMIAEAQ